MFESQERLITMDGVCKTFGAVQALGSIDLEILTGQVLGIVGHNGAGKSTLISILAGTQRPSQGNLKFETAASVLPGYGVNQAQANGIRCVFQELSLCPNLTVAENARILHPAIKGVGWKARARALISNKLQEIFPGHGIDPDALVGDLSIAKRQMVEIARAFTKVDSPIRLVILDEPTSSLDAVIARQLLEHVRNFVDQGGACILISHLLEEILQTSHRVVVMRDGGIVEDREASAFTRTNLVEAMGSVAKEQDGTQRTSDIRQSGEQVLVSLQPKGQSDGHRLLAYRGEIVGLAGLGGHGQTDALLDVYRNKGCTGPALREESVPMALVPGDRQVDGVFPLWSIAMNIVIGSMRQLTRGGLIDPKAEAQLAADWKRKIAIRTPDVNNNILSLSGGNQQKALFARALASNAEIILMDDPMRGVDIGTKQEVYEMIREEVGLGRTFVWYTTEMDELAHCDHIYVFRNGTIVADLAGAEVTEQKVLHASFEDQSKSHSSAKAPAS
ncbi:sugar ABC transporter ATP-binding protein [Pelagibius sp. Alg239-R121]|uniref:sugar ABC transporter ATP-binding protein n=1 Tax=Pelagibius sp. Alg239-R121 TaxID=2993448 RepID=UPI002AC32D45|nr:sugar ABC transporter ATP-binding protein [Pelagibius sp. Alg239-R121]